MDNNEALDTKELKNTFKKDEEEVYKLAIFFREKNIHDCFVWFGGAAYRQSQRFCKECRWVSEQVAAYAVEKNKQVSFISGGGPGIMLAGLYGADKYNLPRAGILCGSIPEFNFENGWYANNKEKCFICESYWNREQGLFLSGGEKGAVIVFPGSMGTKNELFALVCEKAFSKIHKDVPILVYPTKFWKKNVDYTDARYKDVFQMIDTKEQLVEELKKVVDRY